MTNPWDHPGWREAAEEYAAEHARQKPQLVSSCDWRKLCLLSDKRKPLSVFRNVMVALRNDPAFSDAIGYDDFYKRPVLWRPLGNGARLADPLAITDKHIADIQEWMQQAGLRQIGHDNVKRAIDSYAREHVFHPVRDYLDPLIWDQQPRVEHWLSDVFGVERNPYHAAIGRLFLIAMVARIYDPGCKADYMLVIEGEQGKLKSMVCAKLAQPWFSDSLPELTAGGKDAFMHLRGKWLLEIPEMHAFNKAESNHLKSFLTRVAERYRPPYAEHEVDEPRQCLFIGTTNKEIYLKDETGGRRFWPFKAVHISVDRLEQTRDQLLAEAKTLWNDGAQHWPSAAFEAQYCAPQQAARYDGDAWIEPIASYLNGKIQTTLMEIAIYALGFAKDRLGTQEQNRIKRVLTDIQWQRSGRNNVGTTVFKPRYPTPPEPLESA
jgi:predicted P-loop ATPase